MSLPPKMRNIFLLFIVLTATAIYAIHELLGQSDASESEVLHLTNADKLFPIDNNPIGDGKQEHVVSYADVLDDVTPAVVSVYASRIVRVMSQRQVDPLEEMLRRFYGVPIPRDQQGNKRRQENEQERKLPYGMGSGVIISPDGYILTNRHVVTDERGEDVDEIRVSMSEDEDKELLAKIVGSDKRTDIAVLKIDGEDLPYIKMANSDNLRVGDVLFAIGNPLRVGTTVTQGIVSATGRTELGLLGMGSQGYENFIQTDASINPGNSGGALVDAEGRLVGINTAIISRTGGNIGIGFAIPTNLARSVMVKLLETGTVRRGYLGVRIDDITTDIAEAFNLTSSRGALVVQVEQGLPAANAGIKRGDVIVSVDNQEIQTSIDLRLKIASMQPGSDVIVTVMRDAKKQKFNVVLGNLETGLAEEIDLSGSELLKGVIVKQLNSEIRERYEVPEEVEGVVVSEVDINSPYLNIIREGIVIVEINDLQVSKIDDAKKILRRGINKLWVYERGSFGYIAIRR